MRVIGTLTNENEARRFVLFLSGQGVGSSCEGFFDATSGHMFYQVWIHDEDKIAPAANALAEFQKNPSDPKFDAQPTPIEPVEIPLRPPAYRFGTHLTHFFLALCVFVFFLSFLEEIPLYKEGLTEQTFLITPIEALLMYDLPPTFAQLEKIVEKYEQTNQVFKEMPPEIKSAIAAAEKMPYWRGAYDWIVNKIKGQDSSMGEGPLFLRIRQGEVWRLFSPVLLHGGLLHILFNMLWLWYLGRPIEQRIGPLRTLVLTIIAGIAPNTIQYLMSGPFFIGYSGIIAGLAGFIWMRQKVAPWEGYPLNRTTILFLLFFIAAIFAIQFVAFFIQIFSSHNFAPNIANTAHIAGALIGAYLGRFRFFAQRVRS